MGTCLETDIYIHICGHLTDIMLVSANTRANVLNISQEIETTETYSVFCSCEKP